MSRSSVGVLRLLLCVLVVVLSVHVAAAGAAEMPWGTYSGSAVGAQAGSAKESAPIAIKVYVADAGDGQAEVTFVTSKLPMPVTVKGPLQQAGGGWDIPLAVNMPRARVNGTGTLHLRPSGGAWEVWGEGQGTALGKTGTGRGHGTRVTTSTSRVEQVVGALTGFFSFGSTQSGTTPQVPPEFVEPVSDGGETSEAQPEGPAEETPEQTAEGETAEGEQPADDAAGDEADTAEADTGETFSAADILYLLGMVMLMSALGLFL